MSANEATPSGDLPRKPRRRWLQVSLRTLLILVTLLCIWLGWVVNRGERQRRAVVALTEIGGEVYYATDLSGAEKLFDLGRWLPRDYFDEVYLVSLSGRNNVTDANLAHVRDLIRLEGLDAAHTEVTDAGLANLQGLTRLERLDLAGTQVTDAGLVHIQGLSRLEGLSLGDTQVTDAGLIYLQGLTGLRLVYLDGTQVTVAGVAKLEEALPQCDVMR